MNPKRTWILYFDFWCMNVWILIPAIYFKSRGVDIKKNAFTHIFRFYRFL